MRLRWCKGTGPAPFWYRAGGFTLIEIVIVLAIIAVLAGILAPTLTKYVADSKIRRAETDVQVIAAAIGAFYSDVGEFPVWRAGNATKASDAHLAVLKGDTGDEAAVGTDTGWNVLESFVDTLENQLMRNTPGGAGAAYPKWRGPYLETVKADPWGSKYYVKVAGLHPGGIGGTGPVYIISPGPDKQLDTDFFQPGPSITVRDDDIVFRIK